MRVAISRIHFPVTTLGPGRRIGLWLQGCSIRCPGCVSLDTWAEGVGLTDTAQVLDALATHAEEADGLTVSGGEPFDQPEALAMILRGWRSLSRRGVLVFTGREIREVEAWLGDNPNLVDAMVTGPFRSDLPQTLALRGSDNQELHVLTPAGADLLVYDRARGNADRRLDVMFDADGTAWFAGIPERGDLGRLRRAMAARGHRVATSAMAGGAAS